MCGIVGQTSTAEIDLDDFNCALNFLSDRGPDASGVYTESNVAIGHRRLSVIDLKDNRQPLESKCKRYVIAYNGEIYNYLELNKVLSDRGVVLDHVNDTSVLLELYVLFGEKCLDLLNGMFAFVIWDKIGKCIFAARDRVGEKPLYYALNNNELFFASTVAALKKFKGIKRTINISAVHEFLVHQYISTDSVYHEFRRLKQGHYLTFSRETGLKEFCYWRPHKNIGAYYGNDVAEQVEYLIKDSVKLRLKSDVPLGLFLSGGLDSSILASVATKHVSSLNSFCVGFGQKSYDESLQALNASRFYETNHSQILSSNGDGLVNKIINILHVIGEPFADPAMVPMWDLCATASKHVTVALSGDGADEIFGGYRRYYAGKYLPSFLHTKFFSFLLGKMSAAIGNEKEYFAKSIKKKIYLLNEYVLNRKSFVGDLRPKVFNEKSISQLTRGTFEPENTETTFDFAVAGISVVLSHQLTDFYDYLPNDILLKTDRISMHFGLEVRTPFLDHRLIEAALFLSDDYKLSIGQQKKLLRHIFKNNLPPDVYKGVKHGFAPPVHNWLANELAPVLDSAQEDPCLDVYLDRAYIKLLRREHNSGRFDHSHRLWNIAVLYLWLVYEAK